MKSDILGKCPVCARDTEIIKIKCDYCGTSIEGHFKPCKFCRLTNEQKMFVDVFIKCRGNIKEMEKELGVSYPTVKNRLEDVAAAMGYKTEEPLLNADKKKDILDKLNNGEITVDEALNLFKG